MKQPPCAMVAWHDPRRRDPSERPEVYVCPDCAERLRAMEAEVWE